MRASNTSYSIFLLPVKVKENRSDDCGKYNNNDDINEIIHYNYLVVAIFAFWLLGFFEISTAMITVNAATAMPPPIVPPILREDGTVMSVPMVLTR